MDKDDVLAQMTESLDLLGMLEEILESQEMSRGSDPLSKGMRITMRKIREGLTQSYAWIASVDDAVSALADDEGVESETFIEYGEEEAEEVLREDALEADHQESLMENSEPGRLGVGRAVLESVLQADENPAEILPRRQEARVVEDQEVGRFDKWSFAKSPSNRNERAGAWSRPSGREVFSERERGGSSREGRDSSGVATAIERIID